MHERAAMAHRRSGGEVRPYVRSSKPRFNWTGDLKLLFEEAMLVLGGTRKATPKQIREIMKCPDIQLSHIKSRLQMCRIRMEEKERRSGSKSSEGLEGSRRREATMADNGDANGDEHSVVVDENEPYDYAPLLSKPCSSLEYQSHLHSIQPSPHRPFKRLRAEVQLTASCFQSNQYSFDYFPPRQIENSAAVPDFSVASLLFREEQSDTPKKEQANNKKESTEEEEEEDDELQLSLSVSKPTRANKINLDLSLSFPES